METTLKKQLFSLKVKFYDQEQNLKETRTKLFE